MGRVAGVFDNPPGFPCTPPGVDVLEGGKLNSNNVAGSSHDPLQSPAVASGAVSKPGGDAAGQDALHSAGVRKCKNVSTTMSPKAVVLKLFQDEAHLCKVNYFVAPLKKTHDENILLQ